MVRGQTRTLAFLPSAETAIPKTFPSTSSWMRWQNASEVPPRGPARLCPSIMKHNAKNRPPAGRPRAFSLIEVIGVLAVLAIAAAFFFYSTTASLDVIVSKKENATLQSFADSLQNSILRNRYIPGTNDWYSVIATELGASTNTVLTNNLRNPSSPRVFMIDPTLQVGVTNGGLPYYQSNYVGGPIQPVNPR